MYAIEEDKHCINKECKNYWTCKYMKDRFKTVAKGCTLGIQHNEANVTKIHNLEIKAREELLRELNK